MVEAQKGKNLTQPKFKPVTFVILGQPVAWARPSPIYKERRIYDTQKNHRLIVGIELSKQYDLQDLLEGPLHIDWRFYVEMPPSLRRKREQWIGKPCVTAPDVSNLIKFYEDVCKNIVFKDDRQIAHGSFFKVYDDTPRTEFTISPV